MKSKVVFKQVTNYEVSEDKQIGSKNYYIKSENSDNGFPISHYSAKVKQYTGEDNGKSYATLHIDKGCMDTERTRHIDSTSIENLRLVKEPVYDAHERTVLAEFESDLEPPTKIFLNEYGQHSFGDLIHFAMDLM